MCVLERKWCYLCIGLIQPQKGSIEGGSGCSGGGGECVLCSRDKFSRVCNHISKNINCYVNNDELMTRTDT